MYFNLTRIPVQYRALFSNLVALFWSVFIATTQSS